MITQGILFYRNIENRNDSVKLENKEYRNSWERGKKKFSRKVIIIRDMKKLFVILKYPYNSL